MNVKEKPITKEEREAKKEVEETQDIALEKEKGNKTREEVVEELEEE